MGYSYGYGPGGRLVLACDLCGAANGDSRKIPCPFGYCPAPAVCAKCRADPSARAKYAGKKVHRELGCEKNHLAYEAKQAAREARLLAGEELRRSARVVGSSLTQVVFENCFTGRAAWTLMERATYDSIPYLQDATVADYQKSGRVVPGPIGFASTPEQETACEQAWQAGGVAEGSNIQPIPVQPPPEPPRPKRKPVKVAAGQEFRLERPVRFRDGNELDTFTLIEVPGRRNLALHDGRRYRLPRGWRNQVVSVAPLTTPN